MRKLGIITIITFLGLFFYFYRTSGKFRQSIITAWAALSIFLAGQQSAAAKDVDAFGVQPQPHSRVQQNRGLFGSNSDKAIPGPEKQVPGEDGIPQFPNPESPEETEKRVKNMEALTREMEEQTESESESEPECEDPNLQRSQSKYQPNGYSKEQIRRFQQNPRYSELAKDPQLIGKESETNPKSQEEACTILQAEEEGLVRGARRPDLRMGDPNYDYKTTSPTRLAEVKVPRNDSLKDAARLGRSAYLQRGNDGDVTLIVNLMRLRPEKRAAYAKVFLEAAGGYGVIFINN